MDELHEVDGLTFDQARTVFYDSGCGTLFAGRTCKARNAEQKERAGLSALLAEMLGDDIDGIASMEDDIDAGILGFTY